MPIEIALFLGGQLLAIVVFCAIALMMVHYQRQALDQVSRNQAAEEAPHTAYLRYLAARMRIILNMRKFIVLLICIIIFGLVFSSFTSVFPGGADVPFDALKVLALALALVIGALVGAYVFDSVGAITVDAEALRRFQINNLQREDIQRLKLHNLFLGFVPVLLYFEGVGYIILNGGAAWFLLMVGLLFLLSLFITLRTLFARWFYAQVRPVWSLAHSEWTFLLPRIQAWGQAAGVTFGDVWLQQELPGTTNARVLGFDRPTLVISESFLCNSEWRQQDAMIALAIGMARTHIGRAKFLYNMLATALTIGFVAFIALAVISGNGLYALLPALLGFYPLILILRIFSQRWVRNKYFEADQIAVGLTGDPAAVIVAMHTVHALTGVPVMQRSAFVPPTTERVQRIDALAHTPWPRASYAGVPVPAIMPVNIGPYQLTVPLDQRNSEAGAVPQSAYARF